MRILHRPARSGQEWICRASASTPSITRELLGRGLELDADGWWRGDEQVIRSMGGAVLGTEE